MKKTYKKISQATAKKLYESGHDVVIVPSAVDPSSTWWCGMAFNKKDEKYINDGFEKLIINIKWYNCNKETGMRLAFYQEEPSHE